MVSHIDCKGTWNAHAFLIGMAHSLFTPRHTSVGYLEKFFKGHDHARLSWLHEIGKERWGHAADTLMSMAEERSAAVGEDMEGQIASEQRLSCVQVGWLSQRCTHGPLTCLRSSCSAWVSFVNLRKRLNRIPILCLATRS